MNDTIMHSELVDRIAWGILNGFCAANGMLPICDTEYIADSGEHRIWGMKANIPDGMELFGVKDSFGEYLCNIEKVLGKAYVFYPFMLRMYCYAGVGAYMHIAIEQ